MIFDQIVQQSDEGGFHLGGNQIELTHDELLELTLTHIVV